MPTLSHVIQQVMRLCGASCMLPTACLGPADKVTERARQCSQYSHGRDPGLSTQVLGLWKAGAAPSVNRCPVQVEPRLLVS